VVSMRLAMESCVLQCGANNLDRVDDAHAVQCAPGVGGCVVAEVVFAFLDLVHNDRAKQARK
jgi:hypothetical protein